MQVVDVVQALGAGAGAVGAGGAPSCSCGPRPAGSPRALPAGALPGTGCTAGTGNIVDRILAELGVTAPTALRLPDPLADAG
ncbi:MAG: hypothetical protein ABS81_17670 [Pseudonocardia sp. SCN 72-86]|nr:MAG: hypothetical protein ABS81_17670 [Pseudonocardia sp. SCN 72-86]